MLVLVALSGRLRDGRCVKHFESSPSEAGITPAGQPLSREAAILKQYKCVIGRE